MRMTSRENSLPASAVASIPVVLVVEDEDLVRAAAADHLRQVGYEVLEAIDADDALRLLQKVDVDVVLADIALPGSMDGLGLIQWLRKNQPHIRTVVTSALQQPSAGFGMFLSKPYRLIDLDFCIGRFSPTVARAGAPRPDWRGVRSGAPLR
jgi:CheY-like chemotaxis protein